MEGRLPLVLQEPVNKEVDNLCSDLFCGLPIQITCVDFNQHVFAAVDFNDFQYLSNSGAFLFQNVKIFHFKYILPTFLSTDIGKAHNG